jgi:hypothetical protein
VRTVSEGSNKSEYDPAGRLITNRWLSNPDSEASETIRTLTYDGSGRLLTETVGAGSGILSDKVYSYDDKGRLHRIAEGSGDHTFFQYDEQDHKIEICDVAPKPDDQYAAVATGVDLVFADLEGIEFGLDGAKNASRIKTIYDEHDQPTETRAYDADGLVLSRIVRTYDEKQRITDLRVVNEDPTSLFSAKQMAEMAAQSGAPLDEVKAQMKKAFRVMMGDSGRSFTYDSQGRRTKTVLHQGAMAEVTRTYSYNDHGDIVEERTIFTQDPKIPVGVVFHPDESGNLVPEKPPSEWPPQPEMPQSVVHYKYQYDNFGKWTERTVTYSKEAETTTRRELTYYCGKRPKPYPDPKLLLTARPRPIQQQVSFTGVPSHRRGPCEFLSGFVQSAEFLQKISANAGEQVVVLQGGIISQRIDQLETGGGPRGHADGHRPIQLNYRRRFDATQFVVQSSDPRPVGVSRRNRSRMTSRNRSLNRIGPVRSAEPFGPLECGQATPDQQSIPARTILIEQQDGLAGRIHARFGARCLNLHQRDQAVHLGFVWNQSGQNPPLPQRFVAKRRPHPIVS